MIETESDSIRAAVLRKALAVIPWTNLRNASQPTGIVAIEVSTDLKRSEGGSGGEGAEDPMSEERASSMGIIES